VPGRSGPGAPVGAADADLDLSEGPDPTRRSCAWRAAGDDDFVNRLRRQRQIEAIHRLGARVIGKLLDEISRYHGIGDDIDRRLARYTRLPNLSLLRAVGGDRFPPVPLHAVEPDDDG
jgi:hypothetical protein